MRNHLSSTPAACDIRAATWIAKISIWVLGLGWMVLLFWSINGSGNHWHTWSLCAGGWAVWLLIAWKSWYAFHHQPTGQLRWDGSCWWWQPSGQAIPHLVQAPQILLDLQWGMVLTYEEQSHKRQSFWLQQDWAVSNWDDIRRAVYSSAIAAKPDTYPSTSP